MRDRHAERVEHHVDVRAVLEERHVLARHDHRHDALVAVTAGHLVARLDLALHGDEDLDHLHHAGRQLVAALQFVDLVDEAPLEALLGLLVLLVDRLDLALRLLVLEAELPPMAAGNFLEDFVGDVRALASRLRTLRHFLADQGFLQTRIDVAVEDLHLVVAVLGETLDLLALDGHRTLVFLDAVTIEHAHFDDRAGDARRQTQRGIAHVGSLLAEDGAQQLLFRRHRALALRRDLADENVARVHLGADVDDAGLVEVLQSLFRDVGDVARDLLRPELGIAGHHLEFLDVDRGEDVVGNDALGEEDGVLEVVAHPRHERDEHVLAERQIAEVGRRTVGDDLARLDRVTDMDQRTLVDAGVLVRALELAQAIDVDARLGRIGLGRRADNDTRGVHLIDDARAAGSDGGAGVAGHHLFHAGADERRFGPDQRHGLTLHVRAHEGAVGVIVLEERDERRGDRHELLGRHVDVVDLVLRHEQHVALVTAGDEVVGQLALGIDLGVGLRNVVAHLFHGRQVDDLVGQLAVDDLAVRALDEAVLVDARKRRQRVDEADVRAFRRLDGADAAVVRRMHVAHLEARALTRQTARAKRRQAALVGDFRQRVGLVHELGELRGAEELAHGGGRRLGVDQILRHHRVDIDRGHALLDGALHAQQADAVLVLHQLADRAHAAVAEMVDVVDLALAVAQVDQRLDDREDVLAAQHAHGVVGASSSRRMFIFTRPTAERS